MRERVILMHVFVFRFIVVVVVVECYICSTFSVRFFRQFMNLCQVQIE